MSRGFLAIATLLTGALGLLHARSEIAFHAGLSIATAAVSLMMFSSTSSATRSQAVGNRRRGSLGFALVGALGLARLPLYLAAMTDWRESGILHLLFAVTAAKRTLTSGIMLLPPIGGLPIRGPARRAWALYFMCVSLAMLLIGSVIGSLEAWLDPRPDLLGISLQGVISLTALCATLSILFLAPDSRRSIALPPALFCLTANVLFTLAWMHTSLDFLGHCMMLLSYVAIWFGDRPVRERRTALCRSE